MNKKVIPNYPKYYVTEDARVFGPRGELKQSINGGGYKQVTLSNEDGQKSWNVHKIMAVTFLNHITSGHSLVIDHIDYNKLNNNLSNLQIISQRQNLTKDTENKGVYYYEARDKWRALVQVNGVRKHIGYFHTKEEAQRVRENYIKQLKLY